MNQVTPYLSFRGNARDAMNFYHSVLGGELRIDTFDTVPAMMSSPQDKNLVLHSQLMIDDGPILMAADTPTHMPHSPAAGMSVSLSGDDQAEIERIWKAVSEGATVTMPLATPPWGGKFGMLVDKFGIPWMLSVIVPALAA
ncbi:VOC family protein [Microbacterium sp. Leaf320]|uniref:VOC family protein n=1 Tax=Microbacterium sp. Leaf320 TaxID=1736334 RepID=UPI0006F966B8|nr:VOC family protein [Microbacterium sp. Leaf320]KQQ62662.1 hypothetical protein ASF63_18035 [Microbacterium sp. Leaf320]